jgi:hypothetical protein
LIVLFGFKPWLNWKTSWLSLRTSFDANNFSFRNQVVDCVGKCFFFFFSMVHRFHHLLLANPSNGLEHWFFSPLGKLQLHCNSFCCTILANGVYFILLMSKPNMKCNCICICGNLKFIYNHHGCSSTCLCTFCQFLESWSVWLFASHMITCSIVVLQESYWHVDWWLASIWFTPCAYN